jgi:hypothetical protein
MASDSLVFNSIAQSNLPVSQKSFLMRAYEEASGSSISPRTLEAAKLHGMSALEAVRAGGEAFVVGASVGILDAILPGGLDVKAGGFKVPMDGVAAVLAYAGSVGSAAHAGSTDAKNIGTALMGIASYRMLNQFVKAKQGAPATNFNGEGTRRSDVGVDLIESIANEL